jgi:hypothetical protein
MAEVSASSEEFCVDVSLSNGVTIVVCALLCAPHTSHSVPPIHHTRLHGTRTHARGCHAYGAGRVVCVSPSQMHFRAVHLYARSLLSLHKSASSRA